MLTTENRYAQVVVIVVWNIALSYFVASTYVIIQSALPHCYTSTLYAPSINIR